FRPRRGRPSPGSWVDCLQSARDEVRAEPVGGKRCDAIERARLLEEMRGAGHNNDFVWNPQLRGGAMVQRQYLLVAAANDEEGRCTDAAERVTGEIGAAASRD